MRYKRRNYLRACAQAILLVILDIRMCEYIRAHARKWPKSIVLFRPDKGCDKKVLSYLEFRCYVLAIA